MNIQNLLKDRSHMMQTIRRYFSSLGVTEVDVPARNLSANIDAYIDVLKAGDGYLHTSPEHGMKRLLARGSGEIFQLSHVFRAGETGRHHSEEFSMLEWYRMIRFDEILKETLDLVSLFLGPLPVTTLSYRQAFIAFAGCRENDDLLAVIQKHQLPPPPEDVVGYVWACVVEPYFRKDGITVIYDFPSDQAAMATIEEGMAKRFEVYVNGIEVANGFKELKDGKELRERALKQNAIRRRIGKKELPLDESFYKEIGETFPDCCGVALGFDRLMMLWQGFDRIDQIDPLTYSLEQVDNASPLQTTS